MATAGFGLQFRPREDVSVFLGLFFSSTLLLALVLRRHWGRIVRRGAREQIWLLMGVALILRLAALVAPVSLSDDIWRYLWDGQVLLDGANPYAHRPEAYQAIRGEAFDERARWLEAMNSPDRYTVYPPLAQLAFAAAIELGELVGGEKERWLRAIFVLVDLGGLFLLAIVLARCFRKPPIWAALYGWHPLVYWEVAAGGHTEALGMPFLAAAVWGGMRGRGALSGLAIALMGLAKWTFLAVSPVIAFFLWRRAGLREAVKATGVALFVFVAAYLPLYYPEIWVHHGESTRLYSEYFSFNAPVFYSLRWLLGYQEGVTEPVTHITGPVLTGLTMLAIAAVAIWQNGTRRRFAAGITLSMGAYLLFSAVFHPWYALGFLALAVLVPWRTPAVVGAVIALSYLYYAPFSSPAMEVGLMVLQVLVVAMAAMLEFGREAVGAILKLRGQRKAREVLGEVAGEEGLTILDLGGAEGYVAQALSEAGHQVEILDVVDRNRTELSSRVYDGRTLPYGDRHFDLVVLAYVLHHSEDPDRLLDEAMRVGKRVIALETVYERSRDRRLTTFLDHSANRLRGMAAEPLHFDTPTGWKDRIEALGGEVETQRWLGRTIHRHVILNFLRKIR